MPPSKPPVQFLLRLNQTTKKRLKRLARKRERAGDEDATMTAIIREAIEAKLDEESV